MVGSSSDAGVPIVGDTRKPAHPVLGLGNSVGMVESDAGVPTVGDTSKQARPVLAFGNSVRGVSDTVVPTVGDTIKPVQHVLGLGNGVTIVGSSSDTGVPAGVPMPGDTTKIVHLVEARGNSVFIVGGTSDPLLGTTSLTKFKSSSDLTDTIFSVFKDGTTSPTLRATSVPIDGATNVSMVNSASAPMIGVTRKSVPSQWSHGATSVPKIEDTGTVPKGHGVTSTPMVGDTGTSVSPAAAQALGQPSVIANYVSEEPSCSHKSDDDSSRDEDDIYEELRL